MGDARFDRVSSESPLISLVLRSYCLALVKACDFVHARIATEYYYEVALKTVRPSVEVYC